ncbi:MAG TPA: hypothetical protein VHS78_06880 [Candidatus Elarobacter sp.]|jgi:hypothetical protein|nr:hypothetical protein [Candidatus Elarobacter sp.]
MKLRIFPVSLAVTALVALAACGGGGSTSSVPTTAQSVQSAGHALTVSSEAENDGGDSDGRRVSNTFDSFNLGLAAGQQGWLGSACGYSLSHIDATATYPNAKFSGNTPPSKVLVVQNAATDGCYNGLGSPPVAQPAGQEDSYTVPAPTWTVCGETCRKTFTASWTVTSSTGAYQPGIAMSVSPVYNNDGARMSYVGMSFDPNPKTGKPSLHIFTYDVQGVCSDPSCGPTGPPPCYQCANFVQHDVAYVDPTVQHTLGIVMRFSEGRARDRVSVSVDGETVWNGGSWQDYYTLDTESDPGAAHPHSRAVNDLLLHANGSSGIGFLFRNVTVSTK